MKVPSNRPFWCSVSRSNAGHHARARASIDDVDHGLMAGLAWVRGELLVAVRLAPGPRRLVG